jgi:hypothetical protein
VLFNDDPIKWKVQVNKKIGQVRRDILLLEEEINASDMQGTSYVGAVKSFRLKLQKMEEDVQKRERGESFLGQQRKPVIQTAEEKREVALQELFQKGDDAQDRTVAAVKELNIMTQKGIAMADEINMELKSQIEQLDSMIQRTEDTKSTLNKAKKNITYFVKAMECDKCMVGLMALILLALVAVILLAVKKNQGG